MAGRPVLFMMVGLAPMLLLYLALSFGALLSLVISLGPPGPQGSGSLGLAGLALALLIVPVLVALALNPLLRDARSWRRRGVLLYLALDLLALGLLFAFLTSLGGASMAAVEGVVGARGLAAGAALETAIWMLVAQLIIVPWTVLVTYLFRRKRAEGETRNGWN